jgi:hypothetical protein
MNTNHRHPSSLSHSLLRFPIALSPICFYRMLRLPCLTVALLAFCAPAGSMDFSLTGTDGKGNLAPVNPAGPGPLVLMRGEIVPGDYANLLKFAVENHLVLANSAFLLASPKAETSHVE